LSSIHRLHHWLYINHSYLFSPSEETIITPSYNSNTTSTKAESDFNERSEKFDLVQARLCNSTQNDSLLEGHYFGYLDLEDTHGLKMKLNITRQQWNHITETLKGESNVVIRATQVNQKLNKYSNKQELLVPMNLESNQLNLPATMIMKFFVMVIMLNRLTFLIMMAPLFAVEIIQMYIYPLKI